MPHTGNLSARIRTGHRLHLKLGVQNLIDIFKDNWSHIILEELRAQVSKETFEKFQWLTTQEINVLKRVVKETSLIYKKPPERKAVIPQDEQPEGDDVEVTEERVDANYELSQKDTTKNFVLQNINQYTTLVNHTLLKVTYRENKLDYDQLNFNNAEIFTDPDDWMRIVAVKHFRGFTFPGRHDNFPHGFHHNHAQFDPFIKLADGEGIALAPIQSFREAKIWVAEDIDSQEILENPGIEKLRGGFVYTIKPNGDIEEIVKEEKIPYRDKDDNVVLPFVLYSKSFPVDFLLDFSTGNDLRDLNINIAILMIWLNSLEKYQSFKQIVFNTDDPDSIPNDIKTGPAEAIVNPTKEGGGSVQVLDLQTDIKAKFQVIKERIQTVLAGYGISPENFTMSASPQSGFALKISNIGKLEAREAQVPCYALYEKEVFKKERIIWNHHNPTKKIADNAELVVDFDEPSFPKSPKEKAEEFNFLQMHNIITEIDLMMKHNPDLTREQAEQEFAKNKAFNDANKPIVTTNPVRQPGQNQPGQPNNQPPTNRNRR